MFQTKNDQSTPPHEICEWYNIFKNVMKINYYACFSNLTICFFFHFSAFYPQFLHKDIATNITSIFNDTYTLRIVGLKSDQNSATILFSEQQILAYNNLQ